MSRQAPSPHNRQIIRQALLIIGILFLLLFAIQYGRNVLRYRRLQRESAVMDGYITQVETEKQDVDRAFDESLAPAVVEDFAHQLGWGRPDEQIVIPVGGDAHGATGVDDMETAAITVANAQQANWQLWLQLLQDGTK